MKTREVVTCFLRHDGRILLLKRSDMVRTHKGKWAGVSGGIENKMPVEQATQEIAEETGLSQEDIQLVKQGRVLEVHDSINMTVWRVHPFLFDVKEPQKIRLDCEHTDSMWIKPEELGGFDTVPQLRETWDRLWERE